MVNDYPQVPDCPTHLPRQAIEQLCEASAHHH